ncbi:MAG: ribosomal protein L7/L12 [Fibrella sp.]|nr:ribosomal protein L7/L12 [Armatimonadota bacterium]
MFDKPPSETTTPSTATPHPNATDELESRIDRVCRAVGVDPAQIEARASDSAPFPAEIMEEIRGGRKIQAIKLYRDWTDVGLKEAKDAIDAVDAGNVPKNSPRTALLEAKLDAVLLKLEIGR